MNQRSNQPIPVLRDTSTPTVPSRVTRTTTPAHTVPSTPRAIAARAPLVVPVPASQVVRLGETLTHTIRIADLAVRLLEETGRDPVAARNLRDQLRSIRESL